MTRIFLIAYSCIFLMSFSRVPEFYDTYRMTSYSIQSQLTAEQEYLLYFDIVGYHKKESFETPIGRQSLSEDKIGLLALDTSISKKLADNHYLKLRTLYLIIPYHLQYTYLVSLENKQALNFGLFTEYLDIDKIATQTKARRGYGAAVSYEKAFEVFAFNSSLSYKKYFVESYYQCNNYDGSVPKCASETITEKIYNELDYLEFLFGGTTKMKENRFYLSYDLGINFPIKVNTLSYTYNSSYQIENEYYIRLGIILEPNF